MIKATFRVIHFPKISKFIAVAWAYEHGVLISTAPHATYTEARAELDQTCNSREVRLQWFDGEYTSEGELLIPMEYPPHWKHIPASERA